MASSTEALLEKVKSAVYKCQHDYSGRSQNRKTNDAKRFCDELEGLQNSGLRKIPAYQVDWIEFLGIFLDGMGRSTEYLEGNKRAGIQTYTSITDLRAILSESKINYSSLIKFKFHYKLVLILIKI